MLLEVKYSRCIPYLCFIIAVNFVSLFNLSFPLILTRIFTKRREVWRESADGSKLIKKLANSKPKIEDEWIEVLLVIELRVIFKHQLNNFFIHGDDFGHSPTFAFLISFNGINPVTYLDLMSPFLLFFLFKLNNNFRFWKMALSVKFLKFLWKRQSSSIFKNTKHQMKLKSYNKSSSSLTMIILISWSKDIF